MKAMQENTFYIVDKDFHITDFNDTAKKIHIGLKASDICYRAIMNRSEPCERCPVAGNSSVTSQMLFDPYYSCFVESIFSEIGNGQYGVISRPTRNNERATANIDAALGFFEGFINTFTSTYYLDLKTAKFTAFKQNPNYKMYGQHGDWSLFDDYIHDMIHISDREELYKVTRIDYIKERLSKEERYFIDVRDFGSGYERCYKFYVIRGADFDHAIIAFLDITPQMLAKYELLSVRDLVKAAKWTAKVDADGNVTSVVFSNEVRQIAGYNDENDFPNDIDFYRSLAHPDDLQRAIECFATAALDKSGKTDFDCQYRLKRKDGAYMWVRSAARMTRNQDGVATESVGIFVDLNDRYLKEEKQRELEETQIALRNALEEAKQSSRAKTVFLNNMSHDIRTPMNAIIGFTNLAEKNADDKEKLIDYFSKIQTSSNYLLSLINDVLDMSRIESGNFIIKETDANLLEILHDFSIMVQTTAKDKQLEITYEKINIENEYIVCDKVRLNQVLLNFMGNSIKFTPPGGHIKASVKQISSTDPKRATFEFSVKDDGIGMSSDFLEHVFEPFAREDHAPQGTGLGMSIAKSIIDMMGGTIQVETEKGKGTKFTLIQSFDISTQKAIEKEVNTKTNLNHEKAKTILLAEDNELNREIAEEVLTELGFKVDSVENGQLAVEAIQAKDYDLILMDIQMPVLDGYKATQQIRNLPNKEKARTPIIAMTADAFEEDKQRAIDSGMSGHISKPFHPDKILELISENM